MKKLICLISIAVIFASAQGQYVADALRYSQTFPAITARSMSMGSAFSSLGGDYSSVSINPAGLGLYRKSELIFTPALNYSRTTATYYGEENADDHTLFNVGSGAFVGTYNSRKDKGLVSASFSAGYNRLNNFNNNTYLRGENQDNSLADYFMENADGLHPDNLSPFYERLAFDGYIIDTVPGSDYQYQTPVFLPVDQRKTIESRGGVGEWRFAMGINISNIFYAGAGFGWQDLNYDQVSTHSEFDMLNQNDFDRFHFTEDLHVNGTGFNANFGIMVRLLKIMRIGGSLQLPTYYKIGESYYNTLYSQFDNGDNYNIAPTDINGDLIGEGEFSYKLQTPLKMQGGASVQIGKIGIISADIEFIDYSNMQLKEKDYYSDFSDINATIESTYKSVVNLKLGGEVRLSHFSFRIGGGFYPSPYKSGELNENADYGEFTTGLGYRNEYFFFDLGYSILWHSENYNLYYDNIAGLDQNQNRFLATMGVRF